MSKSELENDCQDTVTITLAFENGSIASINYFANGHKSFPKERIEIFQGQQICILDNFRLLKAYGVDRFKTMKLFSQNKGQNECCEAFARSIIEGMPCPISFEEQLEVTQVCLDVVKQLNG